MLSFNFEDDSSAIEVGLTEQILVYGIAEHTVHLYLFISENIFLYTQRVQHS